MEFAKDLGVKGCYQASDVEFSYYGDQGEDQILSEEVRNLHPYIHDFLHSPLLCEGHGVEKSAEILNQLSVHRSQKLEVNYELNGFPVPDPNPRQSFLDRERAVLWLGLAADKGHIQILLVMPYKTILVLINCVNL